MYAFIEGLVDSIDEQHVVIVANGIGYEITCANPYQFQNMINEKTKIFTYHYVREDQQLLFGFKKKEDKLLFAKLLNVSGIGPKSALSIIATSTAGQIANAIEQEDEKFLTSFPGVGKKTARQMILDLKGKVTEWLIAADLTSNTTFGSDSLFTNNASKQLMEESLEALRSLGYSEREISKISPSLKKYNATTVDEYIKKGLSLMMEKK